MPVHKCDNGKFRIGSGPCRFETKEKAEAAFKHWVKSQNGIAQKDGTIVIQNVAYEAAELATFYGKTLGVSRARFEVETDDN